MGELWHRDRGAFGLAGTEDSRRGAPDWKGMTPPQDLGKRSSFILAPGANGGRGLVSSEAVGGCLRARGEKS
jgi:hypothetical protein